MAEGDHGHGSRHWVRPALELRGGRQTPAGGALAAGRAAAHLPGTSTGSGGSSVRPRPRSTEAAAPHFEPLLPRCKSISTPPVYHPSSMRPHEAAKRWHGPYPQQVPPPVSLPSQPLFHAAAGARGWFSGRISSTLDLPLYDLQVLRHSEVSAGSTGMRGAGWTQKKKKTAHVFSHRKPGWLQTATRVCNETQP